MVALFFFRENSKLESNTLCWNSLSILHHSWHQIQQRVSIHELPSHRAFYFLFFRWQGEKFFPPGACIISQRFCSAPWFLNLDWFEFCLYYLPRLRMMKLKSLLTNKYGFFFFKAATKPIPHSRSGLLFLIISLVLTSIQPSMSDLSTSTIRFRPTIISKL